MVSSGEIKYIYLVTISELKTNRGVRYGILMKLFSYVSPFMPIGA